MGDDGHDQVDRDATQAWLTAAERAELGDLTSTVHPLWVAASVSVRSEAGGHTVVEVGGDLATASAAYLDVVLEQEISGAPATVVVDLSGVAFVGVRGIAALVRAAGRAAENLTTLCVVAPPYPDLARQLSTSGLDELLDLHTSLAHCRSALALREPVPISAAPLRTPASGRSGAAGERPAHADPDLRIAVRPLGRLVLVRLSGSLSLRTVGRVATVLAKSLLDGGRVVADLSALRLRWPPALQVFPSTLAALGGWPTARLVLLHADPEVGAALRALRIDRVVPLARNMPEVHALLDRRPPTVARYHELPPEPSSPRRARALLRAACRDWQIETLVPEAAVVVSELVTNAVRHAGTGCRVSLRLDDTDLHVGVRDHQAPDESVLERLRNAEGAGLGLRIVAEFSRAQGVTAHADGKTVWAVLALRSTI